MKQALFINLKANSFIYMFLYIILAALFHSCWTMDEPYPSDTRSLATLHHHADQSLIVDLYRNLDNLMNDIQRTKTVLSHIGDCEEIYSAAITKWGVTSFTLSAYDHYSQLSLYCKRIGRLMNELALVCAHIKHYLPLDEQLSLDDKDIMNSIYKYFRGQLCNLSLQYSNLLNKVERELTSLKELSDSKGADTDASPVREPKQLLLPTSSHRQLSPKDSNWVSNNAYIIRDLFAKKSSEDTRGLRAFAKAYLDDNQQLKALESHILEALGFKEETAQSSQVTTHSSRIGRLLQGRDLYEVTYNDKKIKLALFNVIANGDCGLETLRTTREEAVKDFEDPKNKAALAAQLSPDLMEDIYTTEMNHLRIPGQSVSERTLVALGSVKKKNVSVWLAMGQKLILVAGGENAPTYAPRRPEIFVYFDGQGHYKNLIPIDQKDALQEAFEFEAGIPARNKAWLNSITP